MLLLRLIIVILIVENAKTKKQGRSVYCNYYCKKDHIACMNYKEKTGACGDIIYNFNETDDRNLVLSRFNELRNKVAGGEIKGLPTAARMGRMVWDEELADMARIKALQCSTDTDHCHGTKQFDDPGQSIFFKSLSWRKPLTERVNSALDAWFNSTQTISSKVIKKFYEPKNIPGYRPAALALTDRNTHIGCGALHWTNFNEFYMVCHYSYDNREDCSVYRIGAPATKCAYGKDKEYPNLCITK